MCMHLGLGGFRRQSRNVWELPCWPTEAEFLDVIGKKVQEFSFWLFKVTSANGFPLPGLTFGNLKSEKSQNLKEIGRS